MPVPQPTPIYRLMHLDNLSVCLKRKALHAPNHTPNDGHAYKSIHNVDIQAERRVRPISKGPGGVIHDYVAFYFGPRSPMLLQLHTGQVLGYTEGQLPLIYLVSTAQAVEEKGLDFVFSDGQGIASFTEWYESLEDLEKVDWTVVNARFWADTVEDMDRQRRKQAEFLVHRAFPWDLITEIGVINGGTKEMVAHILEEAGPDHSKPISIRPTWYYGR